MTYHKPSNLSYTQMAMYFDEHIKDKDRNDDILFQYLYHLFYMLANKARYFHKYEDYDGFAIYAATKVYLRAIKQADDPESTGKIKSILNYIKAILYPLKVDFQKETYDEIINPEVDDRIDTNNLKHNLHQAIQADYDVDVVQEIVSHLKTLPVYIKEVIKTTPYRADPIMSRRLYLSVLLTFINLVTLTAAEQKRLETREDKGLDTDTQLLTLIERKKYDTAITWHLDSSLSNYIDMLTNIVKKKFSADLIDIRQAFELPEEELTDIMMSVYNTEHRDNNEEN